VAISRWGAERQRDIFADAFGLRLEVSAAQTAKAG
jgi:hypothetical protein